MDAVVPFMPDEGDLPDAVRRIADPRRRRFVWEYVFNGANGAEAARAAGYSDVADGAKVRAHGILQRDDVQEAIGALTGRYLFSLAPRAIVRLSAILDDPKHPKHIKAIEMALDRTGHHAKSELDVNLHGEVSVNHTDAALVDLQRLKRLGVPREKLEEMFGFSGLERYERMLASRDAKVIEHQPDAE